MEHGQSIEQQGENQVYFYNRPVGVYIFTTVFALSMIVIMADEGAFSLKAIGISTLWGACIWGLGNLLWAVIGDIVTPYIHRDRDIGMIIEVGSQEDITTPSSLPYPEQTRIAPPRTSLDQITNRLVSDHKLWAKGMVALTTEEEQEMRNFIEDRYNSPDGDVELPGYISRTLQNKMIERSLVLGDSLTPYGEKTIPCRINLTA